MDIAGIVAGLSVIFVVVVASGSTLFTSRPETGVPSETANQSSTSDPGHNISASGDMPSQSQDESVANAGLGIEQSQTQKSPMA